MSKRIPARITCSACRRQFDVQLYRSLWIEEPVNRRLVADDKLNLVTCPHCTVQTRLEFPVLCTNVKRKLAIWYEPYPDPAVEEDVRQYAKHFGESSFYATAPRIRDWDEFKSRLMELEGTTDKNRPLPKASPELNAAMRAFVASLPPAKPPWLSHLRNPALRLLYSAIPMTCLVLFAAWNHRTSLADWLIRFGGEIAGIYATVTIALFVALSLVNAFSHKIFSRQFSKETRVYVFGSACWGVLSLIVIALFDPFSYESLDYMEGRHFAQVLFVVLIFPLLVSLGLLIYRRFIR